MTEAPERLWLWPAEPEDGVDKCVSFPDQPYPSGSTEYIRADLHADAQAAVALVVERAAKQLAAARETFCYASPGSDEEFTSLLLGFDTAAGIIRAITTDPELKTQIAHQTQKLSPM